MAYVDVVGVTRSRIAAFSTPVRQVSDLLLVGDTVDASHGHRPLVSACQTWHYRRNGWTPKNRPAPTDPNYLSTDDDGWLTLNWVDGPARLYEWGGPALWHQAFRFLERQQARHTPTVIHCDQGLSRAPTLALAYLAWTGKIPDDCDGAHATFLTMYPDWQPSGCWDWLAANWDAVTG